MGDAARVAQLQDLLPQRDDVIGEPRGLVGGIEPAHQPGALRGDAGRAVAGVAALRLNAPDREHGLARDVHHVAAQGHREQGDVGEPELARSDEDDARVHALLHQFSIDPREPDFEGQRHVIGKHQRRGARAAFAAVHGDEIHAPPRRGHQPAEIFPETEVADRRLEADRQPGRVGDLLGEVEQTVGAAERAVGGGADAVLAHRYATDLRDLLRDLDRREHAADSRLGALAHLDLDRADRQARHLRQQTLEAEPAVGIARAEIPGAELPDQIAAVIVMRSDAAFPGVLHAAGHLDTPVDRFDGRRAERAVAHCRRIDDRRRAERFLPAARPAHHFRAGNAVLRIVRGISRPGRIERKGHLLDDDVRG